MAIEFQCWLQQGQALACSTERLVLAAAEGWLAVYFRTSGIVVGPQEML